MKVYINGEIVDSASMKWSSEDFCLEDMRNALAELQEGEEIELHITSPGGSVFGGNAIVSQLNNAKKEGHKVVAYVHGIAASMASVIACAADELVMDENAALMIHLPWSCVEGNSNDMKKEAETLDLLSKTLVSTYKTKFPNKSEQEILDMMEAETWIIGSEAEQYGLVCTIDHSANEPMKFAAKLCKYHYKNIPRGFIMEKKSEEEEKKIEQSPEEETKEEEVSTEEVTEEEEKKEEPTEETKEDGSDEDGEDEKKEEEEVKSEETTEEEKTPEELKKEIEALKARIAELEAQLAEQDDGTDDDEGEEEKPEDGNEEKEEEKKEDEVVTKAEADRRVSGMQSTMAKKMDGMKKDYEAKINEFEIQIKAKDEELTKVKAEVTSLGERLEKSAEELSNLTSALEENKNALAILNAGVNTPNDNQTNWKALKGEEFFKWYRSTH